MAYTLLEIYSVKTVISLCTHTVCLCPVGVPEVQCTRGTVSSLWGQAMALVSQRVYTVSFTVFYCLKIFCSMLMQVYFLTMVYM